MSPFKRNCPQITKPTALQNNLLLAFWTNRHNCFWMDLPSSSSLRFDVSSNRFFGWTFHTHPPSATLVVRLRCWAWKLWTENKNTHHLCRWNLGHNHYNKTWKTPIPWKKERWIRCSKIEFFHLSDYIIPTNYTISIWISQGFFTCKQKCRAGSFPSNPTGQKKRRSKKTPISLCHRIHGTGIFTYTWKVDF